MFKLFSILVFVLLLSSCKKQEENVMVSQSFFHKYGVPVKKEDWLRNGKSGKIEEIFTTGIAHTRTYKGGVLDGETTYTFPNTSTVEIKEMYKNGQLLSRTEHYESGVPKKEESFIGNLLVEVKSWHETGTPAILEKYTNGSLLTGHYFSLENLIESSVEDGLGTRLIRSINGDLMYKDTIEFGKLTQRISYFSSGEPSSITSYKNDLIDGTRLTFLPGGLPSTVESWNQGKQDGIMITYHNGQKFSEIPFAKGVKHGIELRFRDGKEIAEEVSWKKGAQHGSKKVFAGSSTKTQWYHQGELVSRPTYQRLNVR